MSALQLVLPPLRPIGVGVPGRGTWTDFPESRPFDGDRTPPRTLIRVRHAAHRLFVGVGWLVLGAALALTVAVVFSQVLLFGISSSISTGTLVVSSSGIDAV